MNDWKNNLDKYIDKCIELSNIKHVHKLYKDEIGVVYSNFRKKITKSEKWKNHISEQNKKNNKFWKDNIKKSIELGSIKKAYYLSDKSVSYPFFCKKISTSDSWTNYLLEAKKKQDVILDKILTHAKKIGCFKKAYETYKKNNSDSILCSYNFYLQHPKNDFSKWYNTEIEKGVEIILNNLILIPDRKEIYRRKREDFLFKFGHYTRRITNDKHLHSRYLENKSKFYENRMNTLVELYYNDVDVPTISKKIGLSERKTQELIYQHFREKRNTNIYY